MVFTIFILHMIKVKFTFSFNMIKKYFFKNLTEFRAAGNSVWIRHCTKNDIPKGPVIINDG